MKSKTKSILALTGTLVLGMVLGALIASQVFRARINHFRELRQKKNFSSRIIDVTQASPEQKAIIEPILEDFGQQMEAMHKSHMEEVKAIHDDLRDTLSTHLSAEQIASLEREFRRMTGRAHRRMKGHGKHMHDRKRKNFKSRE